MATTISVVNTKGGVGKSTLAIHLAEAYYRDGVRTLLIDADCRQGTAHRWKMRAEESGKDCVSVVMADSGINRLVADMGNAYEVIVIDGPAYLDNANTALIAVSDIVLLPVQPSCLDLWACEMAIHWISERQTITAGTPEARFVLSRSNPSERVDKEEVKALESTGIPLLGSKTVQRVNYSRTLAEGGSVLDLPESDKAREEILSIYREVTDVSRCL